MKRHTLLAALLMAFCAFALNAAPKMTLNVTSAKKNYSPDFTITPLDKTVTVKGNTITLAPAAEGVTYTLSGYFDGKIINKTKNTVIKLKGAYLENTNGEAALYGEAKTEVSTTKDTVNYIVSSGRSNDKTAAVQCKKNLVLGGSGTLYAVSSVYHGVKGDDVKIKGSGIFYLQGTDKGSALNCRSLTVEKEKSFKAYFLNSKNGVKADNTITISSGEFFFYNNETAFKTDMKKDAPKEPHGITLTGIVVHTSGNSSLYATEAKAYKASGTKLIED